MCLAVPMKLLHVASPFHGTAQLGTVEREIDISLIEEPAPGDYVIVHAGFAIATLDEAEARERLALFSQLAASIPPDTSQQPR
jgi:hydrogenase expression/formation protein HypC